MRNRAFLLALFLCFKHLVSAQDTTFFTQSIFFDTDSDALSASAQATLDSLLRRAQSSPDFDLNLEAFADERGTSAHNKALAQRRAANATQYLSERGAQPRSTTLKSFGESRQKTAATLEETRRLNRRVDIVATIYHFPDLGSALERLRQQTSGDAVFGFSPAEAQHFETQKGTQVIVPSDAFEFEDGTAPTAPVELTVREAYEPSDWLLNGLSTETSDGGLLQTAGMVKLSASAEGRALRLKKDKQVTLAVPTKGKPDEAMQLFYGEQHDSIGSTAAGTVPTTSWRAVPENAIRRSLDAEGRPAKSKLTLDATNYLRALQFTLPTKPTLPEFSSPLKYPMPPSQPSKPAFTMKKPERKDFVYKPRGVRDRFKSSQKKREIEESRYQSSLNSYEKAQARHNQQMVKYLAEMERLAPNRAEFEQKRAAWREEAHRRLAEWHVFQRQNQWHHTVAALNGIMANAEQMSISCKTGGGDLITALAQRAEYAAKIKMASDGPRALYRISNGVYAPINLLKLPKPSEAAMQHFNEDLDRANYTAMQADTAAPNRPTVEKILRESPGFGEIEDKTAAAVLENCAKQGNTAAMRAYVFDASQLNWCNVDRLMVLNANLAEAVEVHEPEQAMMMVSLPKINAGIAMTALKNGAYRSNLKLPEGQTARLVALKVKDGQMFLAVHEFVVGKDPAPVLNYRSLSMQAIRAELARLNS